MNKQNIAIIPARGGSKGIPRKNIQPLGGKPLIAWSIDAARKSMVVDRVIVSTDDEEIAEIAREWGGEAPFLRPAEMAKDQSSAGEAVTHAQEWLIQSGVNLAITMTLYPTHPFRTRSMFEAAVSALENQGCDTFTTVRKIHTPPGKYVDIDQQGNVIPLIDSGSPNFHYRPYGLLIATKRPLSYGCSYAYPVNGAAAFVDIDVPEDLNMAEAILDAGLVDYYG